MQILAAAKRFANKYRYYQFESLKISLKTPKKNTSTVTGKTLRLSKKR